MSKAKKSAVSSRKSATAQPAARISRGRTRPGEVFFPVAPPRSELPRGYAEMLGKIRQRIREERLRVVMAANSAMVLLYWDIGRVILDRQQREGWGARVIDRLAVDLREGYPDMKGFSARNLLFMRGFAAAFPDSAIVKQLVSQLPWGHVIRLLQRVKKPDVREFYIRGAIEHGWSRSILELQIDSRTHERHAMAITNFKATLPPADSDMAAQVFKDPYLFDFLGTADPRREREVGQINVYLSAVDDLLRHPDDKPTIGLLLCRSKDRIVVEYALRDLKKPIGVAEWETKLVEKLPKALQGSLPTIEQIEAELSRGEREP